MDECKSIDTPMCQKEKLSKKDEAKPVDETFYRSLVGCLMYLTTTRPNILHSVSLLSKFTNCAIETHLIAAKRVLKYVKGTLNFGIKFYASRDYSTAEAEFTTASAAVNQALWLRKMLVDLNMKQERCTKILVNNQAVISISNNLVFHGKTKHFNIKLFFLREVQKEGTVSLTYCKSELQLANIFTKPLPRSKFQFLREKLGVCNNQNNLKCLSLYLMLVGLWSSLSANQSDMIMSVPVQIAFNAHGKNRLTLSRDQVVWLKGKCHPSPRPDKTLRVQATL
ncbi:Copia protein, partial [Mucuna pruriens]